MTIENENIVDNPECSNIDKIFERLRALEQEAKLTNTPEGLEHLEQEITEVTDELAASILEKKLQESLDDPERIEQEKILIKSLPDRLKNEGYEIVRITTSRGIVIEVRVRYYRRKCDRKNGKRYKGVYPGLILLGIHDRCTPGLRAMVSAWAALLSSFQEVSQVLIDYGMNIGVKVIRKLTYIFADRARIIQQTQGITLNQDDNLNGRKVVVSMDGGRAYAPT